MPGFKSKYVSIYITLFSVLISSISFSQIYTETFEESRFIPHNIVVTNSDSDNIQWYIVIDSISSFGIGKHSISLNNFGSFTKGKYYYFTLSAVNLYPNFSSDYISVNNLTTTENYIIYNTIGTTVNKGNISENEKIDIKHLTDGLYFLKFENGETLKFIKK